MAELPWHRVADAWWAVKHRRGAVASIIAVVLASVVGFGWQRQSADPVEQEVRTAAALLERDFTTNVELLDAAYLREFRGVEGGALIGTVTRAVSDGTCWGFDVVVPASWLADGVGSVDIGPVRTFDPQRCRRDATTTTTVG